MGKAAAQGEHHLLDQTQDVLLVLALGGVQGRHHRPVSGKDVEGRVTKLIVVAVKKPPFLFAMHGIVGPIQIQDHFLAPLGQGAHILLDEEVLDGLRISHDLFVARRRVGFGRRQFQPVKRAFARHGLAAIFLPVSIQSERILLAAGRRQQRI